MAHTIRTMTEQDWPSVKRIYEQGIATKNATFEKSAPTYEQWIRQATPACRLVLEEQQNILGWCKISRVSTREVYAGVGETSVYIDLNEKGKGIGTLLLQELIRHSENEGFWMLQAAIFPENEASIKLHLNNGFRIVGVRERIGKRDGVWRDNVFLERRSNVVGVD
ncbi:GNAT family N-acetyltransferase [Planococcus shixiaomingii]|uniref:GNAT family N-acetyltransferase n=1 Tax=Planococcus shixiaomingii TaxID=3058393 RepID=UPI002614F1F4|nr:GNAT family N-acetyltransferase [Planococcus sp. N022]WKA56142.1 N-acetyltransferase family protein [Planococcus sp. N022]